MKRIDSLVGQQFGEWTVLSRIEQYTHSRWLCRCSCGLVRQVEQGNLLNGSTVKCRACSIMPSGEACFRDLCSKYKQGAKKRGLTFVLAKEEVRELFAGNCFYCGRAPFKEWKTKGCRGSLIFNGIDRVDSGLGYTPENSVSCCTPCNYAKREMGTEEFLAHIERISQHQTPEYGLCGC